MYLKNNGGFKFEQWTINNILRNLDMDRIVTIRTYLHELDSVIQMMEHTVVNRFEIINREDKFEIEYHAREYYIRIFIPSDIKSIVVTEAANNIFFDVCTIADILKQYRNHVISILKGEMENFDKRAELLKIEINSLFK